MTLREAEALIRAVYEAATEAEFRAAISAIEEALGIERQDEPAGEVVLVK